MTVAETYEHVFSDPEVLRDGFVAAYEHARSLMKAGHRVHVTVKEALNPISARQRAFLHGAVLPQIAEQVYVPPANERFTAKIWKEYFFNRLVEPVYEMRKLPGDKEPTPHRVNDSSEKLGVKAYSNWIDSIIDTAISEFHVTFNFNVLEREATRA